MRFDFKTVLDHGMILFYSMSANYFLTPNSRKYNSLGLQFSERKIKSKIDSYVRIIAETEISAVVLIYYVV